MNYGKFKEGILHISAERLEGYKAIKDSIPEGYKKEQCQLIPGGYQEFEDYIGLQYEYVVPGLSLTEQRLATLESTQAMADAAIQDLIMATVGGDI